MLHSLYVILPPDGIPPYVVKGCGQYFTKPLYILFNLSVNKNSFPSQWKKQLITPIHKGGSQDSVSNYRPVSVLSAFGKTFEQIIYTKLLNHVSQKLSEYQHGFIPKKSIISNLTVLSDDLSQAIDQETQTDVIYLDFSKAFDRVNHDILLQKLQNLGASVNTIQFFITYLQNRYQQVKYNGAVSEQRLVVSGVPQGSNLGPLLFVIFLNDLPCDLQFSKCLIYADDVKIYKRISNNLDPSYLQRDLCNIENWSNRNKLMLNIEKCLVISYTLKQNIIHYTYVINGKNLRRVEKHRDLGVLFTNKLNFNEHIEDMILAGYKLLGFIIRNSYHFTVNTTLLLYFSIVRSKLEFASQIWDPGGNDRYSGLIESVQNKFISYIYYKKNRTPIPFSDYALTRTDLKITKLTTRRKLANVIFISNILNNKIDSSDLLNRLQFYRPERIRPRNIIFWYSYRTCVRENSPLIRMCNTVNEVSDVIDIFHDSSKDIKKKFK